MATIYNTDLTKEMIYAGRLQVSKDNIPTQIAEKVVPVMEVNPRLLRREDIIKSSSSTATGTITVYTTPTDKRFFVTHVYLSFAKDAACDIGSGLLSMNVNNPEGLSISLAILPSLTLTAQSMTTQLALPFPIETGRGMAITIAGTFAAGTCVRCGSIGGYFENLNS